MTPTRLEEVIQASTSLVLGAVADAVDKALQQMSAQALAAHSNLQRQVLQRTERELQFKKGELLAAFGRQHRDAVAQFLGKQVAPGDALGKETDWTTLTLVDDAEVERGVQADRLGQQMAPSCEALLANVHACLSSLAGEAVNVEQHPLRPRAVAESLLGAIAELDTDDDVAQALAQQMGRVLSEEWPHGLQRVLTSWQQLGVAPAAPTLRPRASNGGTHPGSTHSSPASLSGATVASAPAPLTGAARRPAHAAQWPTEPPLAPAAMEQANWQAAHMLSQMFGVGMPSAMAAPTGPAFSATGLMADGAAPVTGSYAGRGQSAALANADFQDLIRQIAVAAPSEEWEAIQSASWLSPGESAMQPQAAADTWAQGLAGPMMAVNVIRAHRDELVRASGGAPIDQMVIDIVAALFDQVLSDPKVSPQMARQIARLQMPVLRVALADMGFFNSRKHPVRRFVNRIATLSAAFDDPDHPSCQACLTRVTALVSEVVEGDFERMDLFEAKLAELEAFVDAEIHQEAEAQSRIAQLLQQQESDIKVQQRYRQTLDKELRDLSMPDFVRRFLIDTWTQVLVHAAASEGAESAKVDRMKQVAHELVLSVQPKGAPELRRVFLQMLPGLMRDLNQGLDRIHWPQALRDDFFGQLLPAHSEGLRTPPPHELTQRMMEKKLQSVDRLAIPSREEAANDPLPNTLIDIDKPPTLTVVEALSPSDAQAAGFVAEAAVDQDAPLDIDLAASGDTVPGDLEVDINLDAPPPPAKGLALVHNIQKGTAYNMQMQGQWKKVRLTWISEGRNFFIFTHGHTHKQTISLTARTLARMCDSGRFRAFEQAELIERATLRARRQLAALSAGARERSAA